jgi:hypothetical protein
MGDHIVDVHISRFDRPPHIGDIARVTGEGWWDLNAGEGWWDLNAIIVNSIDWKEVGF